MRAPPNDARFGYDGDIWTGAAPFGTVTASALDDIGPLFSRGFNFVPMNEVRIGMVGSASFHTMAAPLRDQALYANVQEQHVVAREDEGQRAAFTELLGDATVLQDNCNRAGFSLHLQENGPSVDSHVRVRIGLQANEQDNCVSPDSAIGIGLGQGDVVSGNIGCSNGSSVCPSGYQQDVGGVGLVLVR
jgi:hypothetical protein